MPQYRYYDYLPDAVIPGLKTGDDGIVYGRCLVPPEDGTKYLQYEGRFDKPLSLISPKLSADGHGTHHLYYVITGEGNVTVDGERQGWAYSQDSLIALPPSARATLIPASLTRLMVCHIDSDPAIPLPKPSFYPIGDVLGSEKDVDWSDGRGQGRSRRFVNKPDGFNCSVTLTSILSGVEVGFHYRRHHEGCYIISGDCTYSWNDGKEEAIIRQQERGPDALMINHNAHAAHICRSFSDQTRIICVFHPPLEGHEKHGPSVTSSY